jgi:polysaccharide export outer membrane protein
MNSNTRPRLTRPTLLIACVVALACLATTSARCAEAEPYLIQPGDIVTISVWKETDLTAEVLVRPDGGLSFPLAGDQMAAGHTVEELRQAIDAKIRKYIPDPVVTVAVKLIGGNRIYVVGKVNRPGEYPFSRPVDVMQSLSLAGGATPFAGLNDIRILRRENGKQSAIPFRYEDVAAGRKLDQNVLLRSGDTVVVP